jgi:predicted DNA-binding transcriptional regulator YafY
MDEHKKLQTLLELLTYLSSGLKYSISQIIARFNLTERTAHRYIKTLRDAGFIIPRPKDGLYFIDKTSPYFREISELLHFSKEEADILNKAIHSISNENLLKGKLINKLYALYDFERVADTIVKQEHSLIIHQLIKAIKTKQKVVLCGYHSANSKRRTNRIVEPFNFTTNYIATWAFDIESNSCKTFKNTRINSVRILPENWKNEKLHIEAPIDVFRISSQEQYPVKLVLSIRACELLKEEYPLAEKYISPIDANSFLFECNVCGFEGVGRFVLGLCHEVKVLHPPILLDFIKKRAIDFLN